ncbi:MAG TPA: hypothetical protein VI454_04455 [Verrucomicrobiae bacterium]|jgi:hypothetical protein
MKLRISDHEIRIANVRLRIPFKYGIATMTQMPYLFLRLVVEIDGRIARGTAADCLPAKWFTKDPARDVNDEVFEMLRVIQDAADAARGVEGENAFAIWQQVYARQSAWGAESQLPPLLTHFGTSLVERALIEAVCRDAGKPFASMLRADALGVRLGEIHSALQGSAPRDWLPSAPLPRVIARHTIGLADPLTDADTPANERLDDGLPQSLQACIARYHLRHFKVKVTGQLAVDLERTRRVASVIEAGTRSEFAFSLDGNEAFKTVESFRDYWTTLRNEPSLQHFFARLVFVEQPLHRSVALAPEVGPPLAAWPDAPPMIIDESDGELDSVARALELGYAGTSHKNCKGVFKGVANRCLLNFHQRANPLRRFTMSGEDLCGVGPVAVVQDLAVQAALGNESVERNGHHYVPGLSAFPAAIQEAMLAAHPDLYARSIGGWPTLQIAQGGIDLSSVNHAPLGVAPELDLSGLAHAADWRWP